MKVPKPGKGVLMGVERRLHTSPFLAPLLILLIRLLPSLSLSPYVGQFLE